MFNLEEKIIWMYLSLGDTVYINEIPKYIINLNIKRFIRNALYLIVLIVPIQVLKFENPLSRNIIPEILIFNVSECFIYTNELFVSM